MMPLVQIFDDLWLPPDAVKSVRLNYPHFEDENGRDVQMFCVVVKTADETLYSSSFDTEQAALDLAINIIARVNYFRG